MAKKKRDDPLEPYRKVRKPVPPPGRTLPDRRRQIEEERARRELEKERRRR
jgi:hypothetical protein